MIRVLFLNHCEHQCGVYQYGIRVFHILRKSGEICYDYGEVGDEEDYERLIQDGNEYHSIIYNYHESTMPWLSEKNIHMSCQNIGILHECSPDFFCKCISIDPDSPENETQYSIPRPIFEELPSFVKYDSQGFEQFCKYKEDEIVFGSFGFGFDFKGFPNLVKLVNDQYDNAVIKLVIPHAYFDGLADINIALITSKCYQNIKKPGIELVIYTSFVSQDDLLRFLQSNTMNMFMYTKLYGRGISSVTDYALSTRRPLGISNSVMFRHIYSDSICLYKNSIQQCMENSPAHCEQFLQKYSHVNMIQKFSYIILA